MAHKNIHSHCLGDRLLSTRRARQEAARVARLQRLLAWKGSLRSFAAAEGVMPSVVSHQVNRHILKGGPLAEALQRMEDLRQGLRPEDFIHCARCHLRGHRAGDPDRCLVPRATNSTGLGRWTWLSTEGGSARDNT